MPGGGRKTCGAEKSPAAPSSQHRDVQFANLLAKGVAIEAQHLRRSDLVAAGRLQGEDDQRLLDLAQDAVEQARCRECIPVRAEVISEMPFHRATQAIPSWFRHNR